jgi:predicted transcriptional regulator
MKVAAQKVVKARKDYHTLLKHVRQNPGVHYRELLRASGLGYGTLERQLALLERLGLLKAHRTDGFTRYYNSDVSKTDMELLSYSNNDHIEKLSGFCLTMQVAHLHSKKSCK